MSPLGWIIDESSKFAHNNLTVPSSDPRSHPDRNQRQPFWDLYSYLFPRQARRSQSGSAWRPRIIIQFKYYSRRSSHIYLQAIAIAFKVGAFILFAANITISTKEHTVPYIFARLSQVQQLLLLLLWHRLNSMQLQMVQTDCIEARLRIYSVYVMLKRAGGSLLHLFARFASIPHIVHDQNFWQTPPPSHLAIYSLHLFYKFSIRDNNVRYRL